MTKQDFFSVLYERTSNRAFNPEKEISNEELQEILKAASQAPSAWNLQHWKFLVFQGKDVQSRLHPIAYNQQQILDASAVVAVLGDLEAYKNITPVYGPIVEQGFMKEEAKERLTQNIESAYTREQYPRDAAFSNASLAAMQLMLAAKATGWDTCAIGGFNSQALMEEFNVSSRYVPIMLITIGESTLKGHPAPRMSVEQVTEWAK
ncbi:nitroreductase family protein [Bacillus pseudomycoides]|uniref:Nitroreductase family protein n=1 Tax=Bacillus pseudomycoides TaxID=64104 RepID=A0AA91ZTD8_9BACI|nr:MULTISPECIES: nitroreductase family protein [Bacillus]PEB53149.1 nitroreductase family protein [Bacillus sp. AFS098217]PED82257.1 nitroreductase family protein [Bacillus pseudomycoides]PEU13417.1 nitroreductase family protein [Bacillus sp. AFS014408]PEU14543.1 nitroreductase family protein [Bacillus sp. AFS019443]PFW61687.1 nitroreductase family protein [Bacillus sp. AFS075034]